MEAYYILNIKYFAFNISITYWEDMGSYPSPPEICGYYL